MAIQSFIVLDCETGGLNPTKNPMCSVACSSYNLKDGQIISKFESFVQPYGDLEYEEGAMKWHGITFAQMNSGLPIEEIVEKLCEEFKKANLGGHTTKPALVGHNIGFDIGFIMKGFSFCRIDISKYLACNLDGNGNYIPATGLDTMWMSRLKWGSDPTMKYNLNSCCTKAGVSLMDAHNAANDVAATSDLSLKFMNDLRSYNNVAVAYIVQNRPRKHFQI